MSRRRLSRQPGRGSKLTFIVWLGGTAVSWSVVVLSSVRFHRLIRAARPAPPGLIERLVQVASRLGLRRIPTAWVLPARVSPMLWVPLTGPPRLVLPEELWDRLDELQRDAVLAHELRAPETSGPLGAPAGGCGAGPVLVGPRRLVGAPGSGAIGRGVLRCLGRLGVSEGGRGLCRGAASPPRRTWQVTGESCRQEPAA